MNGIVVKAANAGTARTGACGEIRTNDGRPRSVELWNRERERPPWWEAKDTGESLKPGMDPRVYHYIPTTREKWRISDWPDRPHP